MTADQHVTVNLAPNINFLTIQTPELYFGYDFDTGQKLSWKPRRISARENSEIFASIQFAKRSFLFDGHWQNLP